MFRNKKNTKSNNFEVMSQQMEMSMPLAADFRGLSMQGKLLDKSGF